MAEGKFGTAINCMDGRVQEPLINWMKVRYGLDYVDMITEPGPIKLIADQDPVALESIRKRLMISMEKHHSTVLVVAGHYDCAGDPVDPPTQAEQIKQSLILLNSWNLGVPLAGVYISDAWLVNIIQE